MIAGYKADIARYRTGIVQDVAILHRIIHDSREYVFPERDAIQRSADVFSAKLETGAYNRVDLLRSLAQSVDVFTAQAVSQFDIVQRDILVRDIAGLKREMQFLDSAAHFL